MSYYEERTNFSNEICRTCMTKNEYLLPIFKFDSENCDIANKIMACANVQVIPNDGFPTTICEDCIEKVNVAYDFKIRCEKTDILLRDNKNIVLIDIIDDINVKVENALDVPYIDDTDPLSCTEKVKEEEYEEKVFAKELTEDTSQKKNEEKKELSTTLCPVCGKEILTRKFKAHKRRHEKRFECKSCGQRFTTTSNLRRHEMIHTGERPHKCNECGQGFIQATSLEAHLLKHTNPDLETRCGRRGEFRRHVIKNLDNVQLPFSCDVCGQQYFTKNGLKNHQLQHGGKSFFCSECGKGFTTKVGLKQHSVSHSGEKSFVCDICNKAFTYDNSLRIHKMKHTGERPYKCTYCEKTFRQSAHLKIHARLHAGVKPYKCSHCGKRFTIKGNLTVHIRIHTGETPYLCPICGKGFHDSSSMKKHQRGHSIAKDSS